ncbi:MAG: serine/threonine-protein kinase [Deltaproteobacteria bacterium]|nr:serine/threonine-protein kinase [Deltaproteobacteria bacterium]
MNAQTDATLAAQDPVARLDAHLATLGLAVTDLTVDSNGTLTTLDAPSSAKSPTVERSAFPIVRASEVRAEQPELFIHALLGEGGMGRVLAAEQVALRREVAVKVLRDTQDPRANRDLLREAIIAGRLEHPNIVPVYLLGTSPDGAPLFVMRRIEGVPWSKVLTDPTQAPPFFTGLDEDPLAFHLGILGRVCEATHFAHSRGILHRDLKPDNVMLGTFGEVYVVDWGLAVSLVDDPFLPLARDATTLVGTPRYMAPEMTACNPVALSPRTDVFLLGAILYELITQRAPFEGATIHQCLVRSFECSFDELPTSTAEELRAIVHQALERSPDARHTTADQLRRALQDFLQHRTSHALAHEAHTREDTVHALLRDPSRDETALQQAFTECRFGYLQALRAWSENLAAQEGLQRALEQMIAHHLACKNPKSASALLTQLPHPVPSLTLRVETALRAEQESLKRLEALEGFARDQDPTQTMRTRGILLLSMGVFYLALSVATGAAVRAGWMPFGYREAIAAITFNAVISVAASVYVWRTQRPNAAVRRLLLVAMLMGVGLVSHWVVSWILHVPIHVALTQFLWWVSGGWIMVGLLFDRRVIATGLSFGAGAIAVMLWPTLELEIFGVTALLAYGSAAMSWFLPSQTTTMS